RHNGNVHQNGDSNGDARGGGETALRRVSYSCIPPPLGAPPMLRASLVGIVLGLVSAATVAAEPTGFVGKGYQNADGHESKYVVFVPTDYDGKKEVPVILFLHGSGETKGDKSGKMPVEVGIGTAIKKREKTFPFLTVIPQAEPNEKGRGTWAAPSD